MLKSASSFAATLAIALVVILCNATLASAQEVPHPTPGDTRPLIAELPPLNPPASDNGWSWWWLLLPLLLIAIVVMILRRSRPAEPHDEHNPDHPHDPRPGGGHDHGQHVRHDTRTVRVERPGGQPRPAAPPAGGAGAENLRARVRVVAPPAPAAAAVAVVEERPGDDRPLTELDDRLAARPADAPAELPLRWDLDRPLGSDEEGVVRPARTEPAAPAAEPEAPAPVAEATATVNLTDAPAAPAAEPAPAAPAAGEGNGANAAARTATLLVGAILLSATSVLAQAMPKATMITKVEPNVVLSGTTTQVSVTCNATCLPTEVVMGKELYPNTGTGMSSTKWQKTANGFTMDVKTTDSKQDGWTEWAIKVNGTWLLVAGKQSIYAMGSAVDKLIDDKVKAGNNATLSTADQMMDDKVKAALRNVPSRRTVATMITTEVKTLETRLDQKMDQKVSTVAQNATNAVTTARGDLQTQINALVEQVEKLTKAVNVEVKNNGDLSGRVAGLEKHDGVQDDGIELANRLLLNATDKGMFKRGKLIKNPDERAAIEAVLVELRKK